MLPKAWEVEHRQWIEDRAGTAKARSATWLRETFEDGYISVATGRWEMEKFKQALSKMSGRREAAAGAAAAQPMQQG